MRFDDFKGMAKDCFDKAVKKGVDLSDKAGIMMDKSKVRRSIDELYKGIGNDYYNSVKYEVDLSAEIKQKVMKIDEMKKRLEELDAEEGRICGHRCYNCGSRVKREDLICPVCKAGVNK